MSKFSLSKFSFNYRLAPSLAPESEWLYLVNETFIGEVCIVPLLAELLAEYQPSEPFKRILLRQIDEENEHVGIYRGLLGSKPMSGSEYDQVLATYVRGLPNLTLKLFALQSMLEGVSVGALKYRIDAVSSGRDSVVDQRILSDEIGHTRFSLGFIRELIERDGVVEKHAFAATSRGVNGIFSKAFSPATIAQVISKDHAESVDPAEIQGSVGMRIFKQTSTSAIISAKNEFLERYEGHCRAV